MTIPSPAVTQPAQIETTTRGQPEMSVMPTEVKETEEREEDVPLPEDEEQQLEDNKSTPPSSVLAFPAPTSKRGRPPKSAAESYRVLVEKVSLNTYAVRIRWRREDGSDHPGVVVNRLNDAIVKEIKRSKKAMNNSNRKLSAVGSREPFGRVTSLEQIPGVLFEILCLAREIKHEKAKTTSSLTDDLITVALSDPGTWVKIENMAANGYRVAFSRQNSENP